MSSRKVTIGLLKAAAVLGLLYLFLVSMALMGVSFKLFGETFAHNLITSTSNPLVGLFIGILATSLVQSSSTTTSLVVGFVGGGMLPLPCAIPIIMGANIGTSITNTLVSLTFVARKEDFRRAFAGATVHDFFNLLSVLVLFPLELLFHPIERLALMLTEVFEGVGGAKFTSPLKVLIDPAAHLLEDFFVKILGMNNTPAAITLLALAAVILAFSLIYLVKIMRSVIASKAETAIEKFLFRNDLFAMTLGLLLTVSVQSSSVTTSLIVPLVGAGVLSLKRCYPFTLGANVGTTCTALLASLATVSTINGSVTTIGITAAFAHLLFNVLGIVIFYPLRIIPMTLATWLANLAAESKLWAVAFILSIFFVIPLVMILLI
jgi:sodium-dependent phosphate cotransporter